MEDFEWLNCYDILFACELTHEKFINNKGPCRFCKKVNLKHHLQNYHTLSLSF